MVHAAQIAAASAASTTFPRSPITRPGTDVGLPYYHTPLPQPRRRLLTPSKETVSREWLDERLRSISRRFLRKYGDSTATTRSSLPKPFQSIDEICHALDELVNFCWQAATPAIEVPYMLRIADEFLRYAQEFPSSPGPTFQLLHKLDFCFASMVAGKNLDTSAWLPAQPFLGMTEMVRLKGIVERTRLEIVPLFGELDPDSDDEGGDDTATVTNGDASGGGDQEMLDADGFAPPYDEDDYDGLYLPDQTACAQAEMSLATPQPTNSVLSDDSDFEPEDDILAGAVPRPGRRLSFTEPLVSPGSSRQSTPWEDPDEEEEERVRLEMGNVYQKTIIELGRALGTGVVQ